MTIGRVQIRLQARGYRMTPQRQLLLDPVHWLQHATPEEIGADMSQLAISGGCSSCRTESDVIH